MNGSGATPGAARRYRETIGTITESMTRLRAEDGERAKELAERLVELREEMERAVEQEALTVLGTALQWDSALDLLWHEQWMTLSPIPRPDPATSPKDLEYLEAVVAQRYEALGEAIRRRALLGRR
ncbi:MAG TPA: hypothetical protein VGH99_03055 [Pseudonocardia sp.]